MHEHGDFFVRQFTDRAEDQGLAIEAGERAEGGPHTGQLAAIFQGPRNARLVANRMAKGVERRQQGALRDGSASAAFGNGERERFWRIGRTGVSPSPNKARQGIVGDVFCRAAAARPRSRVRDQPRRQRRHDGLQVHNRNEPGRLFR